MKITQNICLKTTKSPVTNFRSQSPVNTHGRVENIRVFLTSLGSLGDNNLSCFASACHASRSVIIGTRETVPHRFVTNGSFVLFARPLLALFLGNRRHPAPLRMKWKRSGSTKRIGCLH